MDTVQQAAQTLRREIARRVRQTVSGTEATLSSNAEDYADIERLDSLLQAYERTRPAPAIRHRFVATVFLFTAAIIAILLFVRVAQTEFTLELQLSRLGFRVAADQNLTEIVGASRITFAGIQRIHLPPGVPHVFEGTDLYTQVTAMSLETSEGTPMVAETIWVPVGTQVSIVQDGENGTVSLSLLHDSKSFSVSLTIPQDTYLAAAGGKPSAVKLRLDRPRPMEIVSTPGIPLIIRLKNADTKESLLREELPIDALSFEYLIDEEGLRARRRSSILGGMLSLGALDRTVKLQRRHHLQMVLVSGSIANLSVSPGHIAVLAEGIATMITMGQGENAGNLMPRWLEWLKAQNEIVLYWGATTYLFLLMLGVFRWWGAVK